MRLPLEKLQLVHNAVACMLMGANQDDHVLPILWEVHWLPIIVHAKIKGLVLTYKVVNSLGPECLKNCLCWYLPTRVMHSAIGNPTSQRSVASGYPKKGLVSGGIQKF